MIDEILKSGEDEKLEIQHINKIVVDLMSGQEVKKMVKNFI